MNSLKVVVELQNHYKGQGYKTEIYSFNKIIKTDLMTVEIMDEIKNYIIQDVKHLNAFILTATISHVKQYKDFTPNIGTFHISNSNETKTPQVKFAHTFRNPKFWIDARFLNEYPSFPNN